MRGQLYPRETHSSAWDDRPDGIRAQAMAILFSFGQPFRPEWPEIPRQLRSESLT